MERLIDVVCPACGDAQIDVWANPGEYPLCVCGRVTERLWTTQTPTVIGDEIPGGYYVRHGLCHPNGEPRRFDSYSAMRKAADAAGWMNVVERGVSDRKDFDRRTRRVGVRT